MMNADGSEVDRLTFTEDWESADTWSPDSMWLYYRTRSYDTEGPRPVSIYRMRVDTKEHEFVVRVESAFQLRWVMAGRSRFLSVDPSGKKPGRWAPLKQEGAAEAEDAGSQ